MTYRECLRELFVRVGNFAGMAAARATPAEFENQQQVINDNLQKLKDALNRDGKLDDQL